MRSSEINGKTIITVPEGEIVGTVEDVLFRSKEQHFGALVVKSDRFAGLQIVLANDVTSIGEDAVTITGTDKLRDQTRLGESQQMVSASKSSGRQVATTSGRYVGKLSDIHVDPASGKIMGFEVTGGLFARMFNRTHTIEASGYTHLGQDLLIVAEEVIPPSSETPEPE